MQKPSWSQEEARAMGARIAAARNAAGMSLAKLAGMLGVTRATVGHWETGARTIKVGDLWALCSALGVSADKLVFNVERWPFSKVDYQAVAQLEREDLNRIEGAVLLVAGQIGVDVEKRQLAA